MNKDLIFLSALLIAVLVIPLGTQALFRSQDDRGFLRESVVDIRAMARAHRIQFRALRRGYARAVGGRSLLT